MLHKHVFKFILNFRKTNNDIIVKDLSKDGDKRIPNPVRTFEEAFQHFRMDIFYYLDCLHGIICT